MKFIIYRTSMCHGNRIWFDYLGYSEGPLSVYFLLLWLLANRPLRWLCICVQGCPSPRPTDTTSPGWPRVFFRERWKTCAVFIIRYVAYNFRFCHCAIPGNPTIYGECRPNLAYCYDALYVINVAGWPEVVMCLPLPLIVNMAATPLTLETPRVPSNDKLTAVSLGLGFNRGPHGQLKSICHLAVVKLRRSPVSCI